MLDDQPELNPDDVKCRLMESAKTAVDDSGQLGLSIFQQGAGLVNAVSAVNSQATGCANRGLDIDADLGGAEHYRGRANRDESGNYYIDGLDGFLWSDGLLWSDTLSESATVNVWVPQE